MKIVLHTHSASWAESARLALLGAGIEAIVLDPYSSGTLGLAGSIRVGIADDSDLERAASIVAELRPRRADPSPSWWWHKRAMLTFGVAFLVVYLGTSMAETADRPLLKLTVSGVGAILLVGAIILLLLGYHADKRQATADVENIEQRD